MSVGLLLISHQGIASNLLQTANKMLGTYPLATRTLEVPLDATPEKMHEQAQQFIDELNRDSGVLILTDLYGSTPSNIGHSMLGNPQIKMVAGLNLPMLVRILNYPQLSLDDMVVKAISGGQDGVFLCDCK